MDQISVRNFFSSSKAYFIAVNKYDSPAVTDLQTPYNDVQALSAVLHQHHGFTIETVVYKTDDGFDACMRNPLFNPASGQLLHFLRNITAGTNDRVVIYFACHGIAIDSEGNPEGYLLAADATPGQWDSFIKMSEVLAILHKLNCKHLLLILDCCYAGAFRWAGTTRGVGSEVPKTIYYEKLKQYTDNKAWQVLTSAAHDQKAIDTLRLGTREMDTGSPLSPFAELLVKALQTGDADLSFGSMEPDGLITATELSYFLQQSIFKNLFEQRIEADKRQLPMLFPVINTAAGLVGKGEFLFQNPVMKNIQLKFKNNTTNPYKGLDAYTKEDNSIFYGRQRVLTGWIDGKTENIGLIPASEQFQVITLTGPSGIGKSSLAKAGLLAYYNGRKEKKSAAIKKLYELRPGKRPWSVNEMILTEIGNSENNIVLVDQYEELITVCDSEEERKKFEKALLMISQKNVVVVTIRSDFENQFRDSPLLQIKTEADKLMKYRFVVPPFERIELEEIVVQPAMQELLEFKPINNIVNAAEAFVNRIVDDAFQNPGSLPLLSMALSELWEKKENNNLLEQTYYEFGGITGILDRKAKEEYNKLSDDPEGQLLFKQLIFRMVSFEGGRILKRRIYTVLNGNNQGSNIADELILSTPSRTEKIKNTAVDLTNARLIKPDTDESGNSFIEPSHDALLRSWITLTQWLKEKDVRTNQTGQETIVLLRAVADAVNNRVLWANDPRLPVAKKNIGYNLNNNEEHFIRDSIRKKNYNRRIRGWSIGIAASIITALGIFGWWQAIRSAARAQRNQALYLASESDKYVPSEAIRLLEYAYNLWPDESGVMQKMQNLTAYSTDINLFTLANMEHPKEIIAADFNKETRTVVSLCYQDSFARLWNLKGDLLAKLQPQHPSIVKQVLLLNNKENQIIILSEDSSYNYVSVFNRDGRFLRQQKIAGILDHLKGSYLGALLFGEIVPGNLENNRMNEQSIFTMDMRNSVKPPYLQLLTGNGFYPYNNSDSFMIKKGSMLQMYGPDSIKPVRVLTINPELNHIVMSKSARCILLSNEDETKAQILNINDGQEIFPLREDIIKIVNSHDNEINIWYKDSMFYYDAERNILYKEQSKADYDFYIAQAESDHYHTSLNEYDEQGKKLSDEEITTTVSLNEASKKIKYRGAFFASFDTLGSKKLSYDNNTIRYWDFNAKEFDSKTFSVTETRQVKYVDDGNKIFIFSNIDEDADSVICSILDTKFYLIDAITLNHSYDVIESFPYFFAIDKDSCLTFEFKENRFQLIKSIFTGKKLENCKLSGDAKFIFGISESGKVVRVNTLKGI